MLILLAMPVLQNVMNKWEIKKLLLPFLMYSSNLNIPKEKIHK